MEIDHYTPAQAQAYERHHQKNRRTKLTTFRERQLLRMALRLAGWPEVVLDIPCGTGRFWCAFAQSGVRKLIAADNSQGMLDVARGSLGPGVVNAGLSLRGGVRAGQMQVTQLNTSVFDIALADDAVPFVACLRFFHHLSESVDRRRALAELRRVSTCNVAVSLWNDGNWQALRRRHTKPARTPGYARRSVTPCGLIEQEFRESGFTIVGRWQAWPYWSLWCTYLLEIRRDGTG